MPPTRIREATEDEAEPIKAVTREALAFIRFRMGDNANAIVEVLMTGVLSLHADAPAEWRKEMRDYLEAVLQEMRSMEERAAAGPS